MYVSGPMLTTNKASSLSLSTFFLRNVLADVLVKAVSHNLRQNVAHPVVAVCLDNIKWCCVRVEHHQRAESSNKLHFLERIRNFLPDRRLMVEFQLVFGNLVGASKVFLEASGVAERDSVQRRFNLFWGK